MGNITVLCQNKFDERMKECGIDDSNVDDIKFASFISIIGTKECLKYYLDEEDTTHYFNDSHENVLNLDFDDIGENVEYEGHIFKTMTMKQAEQAVDFIEEMLSKGKSDFFIHCRAGKSRSRAFAEFIYRMYFETFSIDYSEREAYLQLTNQGILRRLQHAYWKKHKMPPYENGEDYAEDLTSEKIISKDNN